MPRDDRHKNKQPTPAAATPSNQEGQEMKAESTVTQRPEQAPGKGQIDFRKFRMEQNFDGAARVQKLLTTVPVRKPNKQQFIRVHPGEDYTMAVRLLEYGDQKDKYMVDPNVEHPALEQAAPYLLVLFVDRSGNPSIWPLRFPDPERPMQWHLSGMDAANRAKESWIRIQANMSIGAYDIFQATGQLDGPVWPSESFNELLGIAFKDRILDSREHIILRKLMGEE
jgi:hypothetical protein